MNRFIQIVHSLQNRGLSLASAQAWAGCRMGDYPGPDTRTTAQRLADSKFDPFKDGDHIDEAWERHSGECLKNGTDRFEVNR